MLFNRKAGGIYSHYCLKTKQNLFLKQAWPATCNSQGGFHSGAKGEYRVLNNIPKKTVLKICAWEICLFKVNFLDLSLESLSLRWYENMHFYETSSSMDQWYVEKPVPKEAKRFVLW